MTQQIGDSEAPRQKLLQRITDRRDEVQKWAWRNQRFAEALIWAAIGSSFGSALISASGFNSPIVIAVLAAVPGIVIIVDKSFGFGARASWFYEYTSLIEQLQHALEFEGASVESTSAKLSKLRLEMERKHPKLSLTGATHHDADHQSGVKQKR